MKKYLFLSILILSIPAVSYCQLLKDIQNDVSNATKSGPLSNDDIVSGLKEALNKGISTGSDKVSQADGYFKNPDIKILMPQDAKNVESTLRKAGMGDQVDKTILSMNRAAEMAAKDAKPIFLDAIKKMNVNDAVNILKGPNNAATMYLKTNTSAQLTVAFTPVIKQALDAVNATKYWKEMMDSYNRIPFVKKVNPDLTSYVTQKALDGLFAMIAIEEAKIRQDPLERTSDILKKVFGQ